ncbi:MAG: MBL fold metallo-hydrolase [Phycisphaerae bacterium]|nr:MBL fold metallo-hydrolase [Phycisphaerae bacterium]
MEILFMGTGASEGWPGLFCTCRHCRRAAQAGGKNIRTRTSFLVDRSLLIDPGLDVYLHMLRYDLRLAELDGIIVTHAHADHLSAEQFTYTMPPFAHRDLSKPMPVFGNGEVLDKIRHVIGSDDDEEIRASAGLDLNLAEPGKPFRIAAYTITPLMAAHIPEAQCLFYLIETAGKTYLQANDTGYFPDETWKRLENRPIDLVSLDCTNGELDDRTHHMGASAVIDVVERLRKQGQLAPTAKAVATHFSHNGGLLHHELEAALNPHGIEVAHDGLRVAI